MAKMLLINPRRKARRKTRRNPSPAQLRARAAFTRMVRARAGKRRVRRNPARPLVRNLPAAITPVRRRMRRSVIRSVNPVRRRRRRNPINLGTANTYIRMIKEGLIGGAGAIAIDLLMGQINRVLPTTLQRVPGQLGVGDAVKALITVAAGHLLRGPTKGMSVDMARGALAVQAHSVIAQFLPTGMTLGYASPARIADISARVGPNRLGRYTRPGTQSPMLSRYTVPGTPSPMLSGSGRMSTMMRESFVR